MLLRLCLHTHMYSDLMLCVHKLTTLSASEQAGTPKPRVPSPLHTDAEPPSTHHASHLQPGLPLRMRGDSLLQKIFFFSWLQGCGPAISLIRNQLLNCK